METTKLNGKQFLRSLTVVYFGIMAGMTMFLFVINLISTTPDQAGRSENPPVYYIVLGFLLVVNIALKLFWRPKRLGSLREKGNLQSKLTGYRVLSIIQWAAAEFVGLASTVFYLLTHQSFFLVFSILVIGAFLLLRPTKDKIITDLELSDADIASLSDPDVVVAEIRNKR